MIFLYYFSNFNKKVGVDGWAALFYRKTLQVGFWKIRTLSLERESDSEKKKNSSFLVAKMYDINSYQLLLARVCSTKRKQFV